MSECVEFAISTPRPIFEIGMCVSTAGEPAPSLPTYTSQAELEAVTEDEFGIADFDIGTLLGFPGLLVGAYSVISQFHLTGIVNTPAVQQVVLSESLTIERRRNFSGVWSAWTLTQQGLPNPSPGWILAGSPDGLSWQVVDPATVVTTKDTGWRALTLPVLFQPGSLVHLRRIGPDVHLEITAVLGASSASGAVVTTLPVGFRPHVIRTEPVLVQTSVGPPPVWTMNGVAFVRTSGQVVWSSGLTNATVTVTFTWPTNDAFPNPPYPGTPTT